MAGIDYMGAREVPWGSRSLVNQGSARGRGGVYAVEPGLILQLLGRYHTSGGGAISSG